MHNFRRVHFFRFVFLLKSCCNCDNFCTKNNMNEQIIVEQENIEIKSLKEFIDDYQRVISVIGVFVALGLFWKNIYSDQPTPYISYLCFLITIPLLLEIRKGCDLKKSSWSLRVFIEIFTGIFLLTALSLIADYPEHFATVIAAIISSIIYLSLINLTEFSSNYFKERAYKRTVKKVEELDKENINLEARNEIVKLENKMLNSFRNYIEAMQLCVLIIIFISNIVLYHYTSEFLHGVVDLNKEIPQISIPMNE